MLDMPGYTNEHQVSLIVLKGFKWFAFGPDMRPMIENSEF